MSFAASGSVQLQVSLWEETPISPFLAFLIFSRTTHL